MIYTGIQLIKQPSVTSVSGQLSDDLDLECILGSAAYIYSSSYVTISFPGKHSLVNDTQNCIIIDIWNNATVTTDENNEI